MSNEEIRSTFERLLQWYPESWRSRNGEAMLGTLMEQAEAEARTSPTLNQRLHIALDGTRVRLGSVGLYGLLPPTGVLFIILWSVAEAGRANPGYIGAIAGGFGVAIGLARLAPLISLLITAATLATQLLVSVARLGDTSWPIYLAVLLLCAVFAASERQTVRRWGLILASTSGTLIALLLVAPLPSIGGEKEPPFPDGVVGFFYRFGDSAPSAAVCTVLVLAVACPVAAWLFGRSYGRFIACLKRPQVAEAL